MRTPQTMGARALAVMLAGLAVWASAMTASAADSAGGAPGGPGAQSYLDLARKDCFATAHSAASKVWFTVANGVLSDTFSPTIETSNVSTVQYIVTDGHSFADLQQRDMSYTVSSPDPSGMLCRVISRDRRRGFALVTDYSTDPARASVLIHTALAPLAGAPAASLRRLKVYVRYDPTIDNTGGGGATNALPNNAVVDPASGALVATDTVTPTGPFAAQVAGALVADRRFVRASSGYAGTPSDGLSQLDTYHRLRFDHRTATAGNVVQTAQISDPVRPFTVVLGFGRTPAAAIGAAQRSAATPYATTLRRYLACWRAYDASLRSPPANAAHAYCSRPT